MTHPQDNARAAAEIVVEQRHRDAAAKMLPVNTAAECQRVLDVQAGQFDHDATVQAFARFEASLRSATEDTADAKVLIRQLEALEPESLAYVRLLPDAKRLVELLRPATETDSTKCADCGHVRKEHSYNGACYGLCGQFRPATETAKADVIRDAFLNMIADATRFDEDVDGDVDDDGRHTMTIDYHLTVGHFQLTELCDALGIKPKRYAETLKDAIEAAIEDSVAEPVNAIRQGQQ